MLHVSQSASLLLVCARDFVLLADFCSLSRLVSTLSVVAALAGCSSSGSVRQTNGPELMQKEEALVMPPPGGPAIVGVVGRARGNGEQQTVYLATSSSVPGQNYFRIEFHGGSGAADAPGLAYRTLSEASLRREMAAAIPSARLVRSSEFLQNAYGPFGYAAGRGASGDACLYGWQQIRSRSTSGGIGRDFGMIQIRVRLCDSHATERQLLNVMYGYTVTGSFAGEIWNPYGRPGEVDSRIGQTGKPIYPAADAPPQAMTFGYSPPARTFRPAVPERMADAGGESAPAAVTRIEGPRVPLPEPGTAAAQAVPSPAPAAEAGKVAGAAAVIVPSPDCIGATVMKAACTNKGY